MRRPTDTRRQTRRVTLPSGKAIEVVYFDAVPAAPAGAPTEAADDGDRLHVCGSCDSPLVHPLAAEPAGRRHWEVTLRCPNCEWVGTGVFDQDTVDRFEDELDRGMDALVRDLRRLAQDNMAAEVERFTQALAGDHIVADDF